MNNYRYFILASALCASTAICAPSFAQSGMGGVTPQNMLELFRNDEGTIDIAKLPTAVMPDRIVAAIEAADKNKDGVLDSAEEKALLDAFAAKSANGGQNGSKPQTQQPKRPQNAQNAPEQGRRSIGGPGRPGMGGGMGGPGMLNAFRNADGKVELAKLPNTLPEEMKRPILAADKNKDGVLDSAEEKALLESMASRMGQGGDRGAAAPVAKMRKSLTEQEKADRAALRAKMIDDGVKFLAKAQSENGSFSANPRVGIGPTLIDAVGLLRVGVKLDDPTLAKALAFLEASVHEDGGIYSEGMHLSTYESCLGLVCFMLANKQSGDGRYDSIVKNAEKFVRGSQYNEENGVAKSDEYFGGVGYGSGSMTRPDLSNTQFFIEALREIGAGEDDPAIQDALVFVSRCQNLESNDTIGVGSASAKNKTSNDGGFIYTFVAEDQNPAGQEVSGGLRSYGSITYAGLKSLIYAGLEADDPRVAAATGWIRDNYSMEQNPGLGKKGLYYYYHTLSKCFSVIGEPTFEDKSGVKHAWRDELTEALALAENADGSWANEDRMWYENDPSLVTGYVLIVLSYCAEQGALK